MSNHFAQRDVRGDEASAEEVRGTLMKLAATNSPKLVTGLLRRKILLTPFQHQMARFGQ